MSDYNHWEMRLAALSADDAQIAKRLLPVLRAVSDQSGSRVLIAIDGPCGSGKTTIAALLCRLLDCPCVHMDDFHIPHDQKTDERLAQPGGNSDRERILREVILPWRETGRAVYQPYDCALDCLASPVTIPDSRVLVLEGSYSHHPELTSPADVRLFVQVSREEQLRRIEHRCPEKLQMFIDRWIPLEESYFRAFALPDADAIVIDNHSVHGM